MITPSPYARTSSASHELPQDWRSAWRAAIQEPAILLRELNLTALIPRLPPAAAGFPLKVPRSFLARMRAGDPRDPLLLQVLPQLAELDEVEGYGTDPVGDAAARAAHGVLHKYQGRALLIASGSCAVHCRYCFRRHYPYADDIAAANQWREALAYLREHQDIEELILSGGDPLSLSNEKLRQLNQELAAQSHIRRLRIHSRLPIVLPERIDAELQAWLTELPLQKVLVLHANHANEFDPTVDTACQRLRDAGVTLLNQAVLLKGINDDAQTLAALCERGFAAGVLPYYLHQLDQVQGAAHFEVSDTRALELIETLRARLPGYLVPKLVREIRGDTSKRPL